MHVHCRAKTDVRTCAHVTCNRRANVACATSTCTCAAGSKQEPARVSYARNFECTPFWFRARAHVRAQRICTGIVLDVRPVHVTRTPGRPDVRTCAHVTPHVLYGDMGCSYSVMVPSQRTAFRRGSHAKWAALTGRNMLGLRPAWPTGHVHVQLGVHVTAVSRHVTQEAGV